MHKKNKFQINCVAIFFLKAEELCLGLLSITEGIWRPQHCLFSIKYVRLDSLSWGLSYKVPDVHVVIDTLLHLSPLPPGRGRLLQWTSTRSSSSRAWHQTDMEIWQSNLIVLQKLTRNICLPGFSTFTARAHCCWCPKQSPEKLDMSPAGTLGGKYLWDPER